MALTEAEKKKIEEEEAYRVQVPANVTSQMEVCTSKSKIAAGILAIFLEDLGIHKFYLGRPIQGIIYLLFFWTGVPGVVGFFEGIIYLLMSDSSFGNKYG